MKDHPITSALLAISYEIEDRGYYLSSEMLQIEVFRQIQKDASMVGLEYHLDETKTLQNWYDELKTLLTLQLTKGDVRSFLYRIDVSEQKIRQIDNLSVDDLCILVLEREFRKVCIRKHFSP